MASRSAYRVFAGRLPPWHRPMPRLPAYTRTPAVRSREALNKGYDNAVVLDGLGNVAELATANLWYAKDGEAHTPIANGTFLNGVTKQRVAKLLRKAGVTVHERTITYPELLDADEIFSTGNYGKVIPINRIDGRDLQPGPVYALARKSYWDYAHG